MNDPLPRIGGLYVDDAGRVVMPVSAYTGIYGRAMADCVFAGDIPEWREDPCYPELMALRAVCEWDNPLSYFADELSEIAESATDREVI
jgi:hypothetical protein